MIRRLLDWLDQRTGFGPILHEALYERVPGGARWRYVWGSTLVFTFVTQVITGLFLWTAYSSSAQTAWESVYYIEQEMTLGSVVRGIHHFTASAMVVLLGIHMVQVIIDGAYRAPREINFWVGLVLLCRGIRRATTQRRCRPRSWGPRRWSVSSCRSSPREGRNTVTTR